MMRRWYRPVGEIPEYGEPITMHNEPNGIPAAFAVRIHQPATGSAADPGGKGHYVAYGNACTHMGCLLFEKQDPQTIRYLAPEESEDSRQHLICGPCPCHGTSFDLTRSGLVILGPATQDLPQLAVAVSDGNLTATEFLDDALDPREEIWPLDDMGSALP